jgi:hypothetical protein
MQVREGREGGTGECVCVNSRRKKKEKKVEGKKEFETRTMKGRKEERKKERR